MNIQDRIKAAVEKVPGYTVKEVVVEGVDVMVEIASSGANEGWASPAVAAIKALGLFEKSDQFDWQSEKEFLCTFSASMPRKKLVAASAKSTPRKHLVE